MNEPQTYIRKYNYAISARELAFFTSIVNIIGCITKLVFETSFSNTKYDKTGLIELIPLIIIFILSFFSIILEFVRNERGSMERSFYGILPFLDKVLNKIFIGKNGNRNEISLHKSTIALFKIQRPVFKKILDYSLTKCLFYLLLSAVSFFNLATHIRVPICPEKNGF